MPVTIPLRQPGIAHRPPLLALWRERQKVVRTDLQDLPTQVRDTFVMDDHDHPRQLDFVLLFMHDSNPPIPNVLSYRFPYTRSSRGQIVWKRAHVKVEHHVC